MIEICNVTLACHREIVLDDVTLTIRNGRVTGIVESNAATRAALLDVISGVTRPTSGTVLVNGYDVIAAPGEVKRQVGYAPVTLPLFDDMTAVEYLYFVAKLKGVEASDIKREISEVMVAVSFPPAAADKLLDSLTPRHRKLLCIATALVGDPEVILLDEPLRELSSADAADMVELMETLGEAHIVLITAASAERLPAACEDVYYLKKLKSNETVEEVASNVDDL